MAVILFFAAFALLGAIGSYVTSQIRKKRARAVAALAQRIGFSFTAEDYDECVVHMPFALFSKGERRRVELMVSGTHESLPLQMFDYWYYEQSGRSGTYHRFTCALLTIPAACPELQVSHEDFVTRLGEHLGLHDVTLEYDDFNKRFRVKCNDQKFAFALLDGEMMQWLLGADGFATFEVIGPWVLLACAKLDPAKWLDLGTWLTQFHSHVPPVVYTAYPPR